MAPVSGVATLGFPGGAQIAFRVAPEQINWDFQVDTSVTNTIGGRVVQVLGSTLSDVTIRGSYGEDHTLGRGVGSDEHPGRSWKLAEAFVAKVREIQRQQVEYSVLTPVRRKAAAPATFSYAPLGIRLSVYVKSITDPQGGAITHTFGKFHYQYVLTLFVDQDASAQLVKAGTSNGYLDAKKAQAVQDYIARISEGIGWGASQYNGPQAVNAVNMSPDTAMKTKGG